MTSDSRRGWGDERVKLLMTLPGGSRTIKPLDAVYVGEGLSRTPAVVVR